jgi:hypothetical protein
MERETVSTQATSVKWLDENNVVSVTLHDREPTAADIILYDAKNRKLYYVSFKT